jgi:CIC family chloride channel protein
MSTEAQRHSDLGDFTVNLRLLWLSLLAVGIGCISSLVAVVLLKAIDLFTNLFFFQELSLAHRIPAEAASQLGLLLIGVPVVGGLIVGLMARYGSERIRGHGIPEAIEAILIGRSRLEPRVAVLKPLSSAIAIGSGGPFGAEGPIIMTGGAFGSIIAQVFHLSAAERKTLLVAGAAGGMSATFGTPLAAVLLAVELLLFEWKPRSLIPVALASWLAALLRLYLLPETPLFPVPPHALLGAGELLCALPVGLLAGLLSLVLTVAVYKIEDIFYRFPMHWMWWPALGGLVVGIGGYFQPRVLGVGYEWIGGFLQGRMSDLLSPAEAEQLLRTVLVLMLLKGVVWSVALGSGTSGGVLAPLLLMGSALGMVEARFLPAGDARLWALVSMAATLGGTMRVPLTSILFALELTHDLKAAPALLLASITSYAVTVLLLKRSILTEKVARRGYHVRQEYTLDPLERLPISDVMTTQVVTIPASLPVKELIRRFLLIPLEQQHQGYPVVDDAGRLVGVITRNDLLQEWLEAMLHGQGQDLSALDLIIAYDLIRRPPIVAYPWESCRVAAERMAAAGVGRLPVVAGEDDPYLVGLVTRSDLLKPRARQWEEEERRERCLSLPLISGPDGRARQR